MSLRLLTQSFFVIGSDGAGFALGGLEATALQRALGTDFR
jgi:hypothetical protein